MPAARTFLIWFALICILAWPLVIAARSPLLAWREPVYIAASFAGIAALGLCVLQPLLAGGALPGVSARLGRAVHRWVGLGLLLSVLIHVGGLWLTSPPDVVDALLLRSPTPFSAWGVAAMWALFAAAGLALVRRRLKLTPRAWRLGHIGLVTITVAGTVAHALLIEGTMGPVSKIMLCLVAVAALVKTLIDLRVPALIRRVRS
ncbi:MAG: ferric reductase-like transmembrane domain-containing protein [Pseudomonadota bacterium]